MKKYLLFLFIFFVQDTFSVVPHISGRLYSNQPPSIVNPKVQNLYQQYNLKRAPALEIAKVLNTIGTKKIAVIIVDFRDQQFNPGWHIKANQNFQNFVEYYKEISYGQLNLEYKFVYQTGTTTILTGNEVPFRMLRNASYYADNTLLTLSRLVRDALTAARGIVNSTVYDYVMVLHAGYGAETMPDPTGYIWSAYVWWVGSVYGFEDGTVVPEDELNASPLGTICHEFGHQLGLPDLYYTTNTVVGRWCLMDAGIWAGNPAGSSPTHLSAWAKKFLGWIQPQLITFSTYVFLNNIEELPQAIKLPILESNSPESEYFLLEYRKKVLFDSYLPGEGILIWRIDDNIASDPTRISANDINSGDPHYGVCVIEADMNSTPISINIGDSGDPFPGFYNVKKFVPEEYNVYAYNGSKIKLSLRNINIIEDKSYFDIIYGDNYLDESSSTTQPTPKYYSITIDVSPRSSGYVVVNSSSGVSTIYQFPFTSIFEENTTVGIEAVSYSTANFVFSLWDGDIISTNNPISIIADSDKYIIANFEVVTSTYEVSIDTIPPAKITTLKVKDYTTSYVLLSWISVGDDGYNGVIPTGEYIIKYSTFYDNNDLYFWFKGDWNDEINRKSISFNIFFSSPGEYVEYKIENNFKNSSTYYFCVFTLDENRNLSEASNIAQIYFQREPQTTYYKLTIIIQPDNSGFVIVSPPQLVYQNGIKVTLFAEPDIGYIFDSWSGDYESKDTQITITMDNNKTLIANFKKETESLNYNFKNIYFLSLNKDGKNDIIDFSFADEVKIYNVKGEFLGSVKSSKFNGELNKKTLKPGIYIYRAKHFSKIYTGYIIIGR